MFALKLLHPPCMMASGPLEPILTRKIEEACAVRGAPIYITPSSEQKSDDDIPKGTPSHRSHRQHVSPGER
uniref:Uncharacterized protein n=1 Tax=Arundo donax TaxID=35708 RepID=A0A0A9CQ98_ARUDO